MKHRYLEVTYRKGRPFAAYLYLPRASGANAVRTEETGHGLNVDYDADDNAIGVELTAPTVVTSEQLNELLVQLGQAPLLSDEWSPLAA